MDYNMLCKVVDGNVILKIIVSGNIEMSTATP